MDDEPEWHTLLPHKETISHVVSFFKPFLHYFSYKLIQLQLRRDDLNDMEMILTPTDHLSPPSTTSRLSDSDTTSECDIDGMTAGRDGASISSFGSSSSPPFEVQTK